MTRPHRTLAVLVLAFVFGATAAHGAGGFSWQIMPNAPSSLTRIDDLHFVDQSQGWIVTAEGKIWHTMDGGQSWEQQLQVLSYLRSIYFVDDQLGFAGSLDNQGDGLLYRTTNGGDSWILIDDLIPDPEPLGLCGLTGVGDFVFGSGRYFGGSPRIIRSTDRGATWTTIEMSAHVRSLVDCHFITPDTGFVVGSSPPPQLFPRILSTFDGGATWQVRYTGSGSNLDDRCWKIDFPTRMVGYATIELFVPGAKAVLKTTDGGMTWSEIVIPEVRLLQGVGFVNPLMGWVDGQPSGTSRETTDGGLTWVPVVIGQVDPKVNRFQMFGETFGYAVGRTVYKYLPDIATVAAGNSPPPPSPIHLSSRPNPFQSSTTIQFTVPSAGEVRVRVYEIDGRQIRTLVRGWKAAGQQEVSWDGRDDSGETVAAGNYIVRVDASGDAETRFVSYLH